MSFNRVALFSLFLSLLFAGSANSAQDELRISEFTTKGLAGWEEKSFKGNTEYRLVADGERKVLQATSRAAASGMVFDIDYDPKAYPMLTWRWKVSNIIAKGDERSKAGDDYAARVYVIFPHWFFPKTRSLNYIWANRLAKDELLPNAFTGNAVMIAVESGADKVGDWVTVRRDIVADYRRAFGEDPPEVGAIAIMTDTDNTGEAATAWYADIVIHRR